MDENISEIRKRAWRTRREKYGPRGNNGSYTRGPSACQQCERMVALLVRLHHEGCASEGQVAKATGLHRIEIRRRADEWRDYLDERAREKAEDAAQRENG